MVKIILNNIKMKAVVLVGFGEPVSSFKIKELNKKKPKATQKKALEKWNLRKENLVNQFNDLPLMP